PQEIREIGANQHRVAVKGREPKLVLEKSGSPVGLKDWAGEILAQIEPLAAQVDAQLGGGAYAAAFQEMKRRLDDASLTPSARVLSAMARNHGNVFVRFALVESTLHKAALKGLELPREV